MRKYTVGFLFLFIALFGSIGHSSADSGNPDIEKMMKEMQMDLVSENEHLQFYMNKGTVEFAIITKKDSHIWYSNPPDVESDAIATLDNKEKLKAQISVRYLNRRVQEGLMNSYTDAIKEGQFEIKEIEGGVRVTYSLGKEIEGNLIPQKITKTRMESFINQMDEKQQKAVLSLYMDDSANDLYSLRTKAPSFKQKEAAVWFAEVGYTIEEFNKDLEEHDIEGAEGAHFTIPVEYTLSEESFVASIDSKGIVNGDKTTLTDIKLLEFFGAANANEEGYMFVPDGSGALIDFNNGKTTASTYVSKVYGIDETLHFNTDSHINQDIAIRMPVYGIKKADKALLAMIDEGASHASIYGDVSGKTNSYNIAHAEFNIVPNGKSALQNMTGNGALQLYQKQEYDGQYTVRYLFLGEKDADYSGMARHYQSYLEDTGQLTRAEQKSDIPFYMEVLGGINVRRTFLGVPYAGIETLTTYSQAQQMVEKVKGNGVNHINVIMNGWFNGGVNHEFPSKVNEIKGLNDQAFDRKTFSDYAKKEEIDLYYDVDFGYVYHDKSFDQFSKNKLATRYFDNTIAALKKPSLVSGDVIRRKSSLNPEKYILNASAVQNAMVNFLNSDKGQTKKLALRSLANNVSSDFSLNNETDRETSVHHYQAAFQFLVDQKIELLGRNANHYSLRYMEDVLDVAMNSNEYAILDETVPFYQMVLKGYVEYAGKPLNRTDDIQKNFLKAVESGAGLSFLWIYEGNHKLKDTEFSEYFSVNFDTWSGLAIEKYKEMNELLKGTQNQRIIKHEQLAEDVYQTSYENGIHVYVNYGDQDVKLTNGVKVKSRNFEVGGVRQ